MSFTDQKPFVVTDKDVKAPTIVVYKNEQEVHRFVGALFKQADFLAVLQPILQESK